MRADIFGALKSATEHGSSLEQAVQSLLNSGYSPQDVKEAADALAGRAAPVFQQVAPYQAPSPAAQAPIQTSQAIPSSQAVPVPQMQQVPISGAHYQEKPKEAGKGIVIAIIVLLIIVLAGLGFTIYRYLFS